MEMLWDVVQILVNLVSSYRYDKELVNSDIANYEAEILNAAIQKKQLDHDNLVMILGTRNVFQLKETFQCYKQNYGSTIDQVHFFFFSSQSFVMHFLDHLLLPLHLDKSFGRTLRIVEMAYWNLS